MCDDSDALWLVGPAANSQARLGRVLDCDPIRLRAGGRDPLRAGFDARGPQGRPRLVVGFAGQEPLAALDLRPLVFEYLLRVAQGSLPASFSRQCFEELRHFRMRLVGRLGERSVEELELVRLNERGLLEAHPLGIILQVSP